jgi:pyrimidine-nucleoside phosphorylase
MTGQTKEIVPADRLLYALRDVSATVESIPLITASILSKKVAEGAEGLVFDVKFGSGAFMKDPQEAEKLARSLVDTGAAMGKRIIALLTDMNEPLGNMVGNFLEVEESLDCLEGHGPADLMEVTLELAARMVVLGNRAKTPSEGRKMCEAMLLTQKPRQLFLDNIKSQGGDVEKFLSLRGNYRSPHQKVLTAARSGFIKRIDAYQVGIAGVYLGVGRNRTEDAVSPTAGLQFHKKGGDPVRAGEPIMTVWAANDGGLQAAIPLLQGAVEYADSAPGQRTLILKEIASA